MRKIQADNIDPRPDQIAKYGFSVGSRAERGDDFRAALRRRVGQAEFSKWHSEYSSELARRGWGIFVACDLLHFTIAAAVPLR
jgi:hypothetical protein